MTVQAGAQQETSEEEIAEIYAEVDGKTQPDKDTADPAQKAVEAAEPADKQKVVDAAQPGNGEGEGAGDTPEEVAEKAQKELTERAVKIGLPETATEEEVVAKEKESQDAADQLTPEAISEFAIKHGMTLTEAEADMRATRNILKNYKSPEEIARALKSTQSELDKVKNAAQKKTTVVTRIQRLTDAQFIEQAKAKLMEKQEEHVNKFREMYPAKAEMMTDEVIIETLAEKGLPDYKAFMDEKEKGLKTEASKKREKYLTGWAKEDQVFLPEVKAILDATPDSHVLADEDGSLVKDLLYHAMGKRYRADLKAATAEAFRRGQQQPEIAGAINGPSGTTVKKTVAGGGSLNAEQKAQAEEMFSEYPREVAWEMYKDTWKDELKQDKNFLNK